MSKNRILYLDNLKILLKKCTIPDNAIAKSTGKNIMKTGVSIVPKPKPEKKVNMAVIKAAKPMISISINYPFLLSI